VGLGERPGQQILRDGEAAQEFELALAEACGRGAFRLAIHICSNNATNKTKKQTFVLNAKIEDSLSYGLNVVAERVRTCNRRLGFSGHSETAVGVARQYCGQVGKQDNCRVAVSLSVTTDSASMPVAYRLYLPEVWIKDDERRKKTGVPEEVQFQTKPDIALEQIRRALQRGVPQGVVLADAGYGNDTEFRLALTKMEMTYVMGVQSTVTVWKPGQEPKPARPYQGIGRPPKLLRRDRKHQPISAKDLALSLPSDSWKKVNWRQGVDKKLQSRFATVRVRPAHRDYWHAEPYPAEWLLIEWPVGESEPTKYWLSSLPLNLSLKQLVRLAKHRWIIERDYQELKQELGLGHYEGRGWRGFHHHATLCIAAYGFLVAERNRFSPSARVGHLGLPAPQLPPNFRPRGSRPAGTA
jgi:SRSO17 transposase